jgi:hypothetical protein
MAYQRSQMVYDDYKWTAAADHDNPKFIGAQEKAMLNRSEGYEMLYFINSLALTWNWNDSLNSYRNLERIIRTEVPSDIRTHGGIRSWIESHHQRI